MMSDSPKRGEPTSGVSRPDVPKVGSSPGGLVCHQGQEMPNLCISIPGHSGSGDQCISWEKMSVYAFPPQAILNKVLQIIAQTRMLRLILGTPLWQKQAWYQELVGLATEGPIPLPKWKHLLRQPQSNLYHRELESLNLQGWLVIKKS